MARHHPAQDYDLGFAEDDRGDLAGPRPGDWALLLLRAARRRKVLFTAAFLIGCSCVVSYYRLRRPIYRVDAKILAQRQQVVPSTVRSAPDDSPIRTAWELIHRRENLLAIIKTADLMEEQPAGTLRGLGEKVTLREDREDPLDRMVKVLDRSLKVSAEEGTITVSVDWADPKKAYRIVDAALTNFIEARHVQEVTAIDEVMSVLRARAAKAKDQLDRVTDDVRREYLEASREVSSPLPRAAAPTAAVAPVAKGPSEELIRLKSVLEGKHRAIEDVEEFRRRRLAELHAQLDERRNTYSDAHPSVIQLRQDIDSLSKDSAQVAVLREEEAKLRKEYEAKAAQEGAQEGATAPAQPQPQPQPSLRAATPPRQRLPSIPVEDDERVRGARFEYQQIVERVNGAQLELDAVRAAFKYRYNVVWPPQMPTDPVSPNPVKVFGAGFLAALFLALVAAAVPDLRSGRIVERWQVERGLGLPVLAEIGKK